MSVEKPQPSQLQPEGCLTAFIRIPVRIVVLVLVVPVRMAWDVLVVAARAADRVLLRPLGRALGRFFGGLFHYLVVVPARALYRWARVAGRGVAAAATWLHAAVLAPLGNGLLWLADVLFVRSWIALWRYAVVPFVRHALVVPALWTYRRLLTPLCTAVGFLIVTLIVLPLGALWRSVVVPVARYGIAIPAVWLYRVVLTPLGRALVWSGRALLVWPWVGLWRYVVVPVVRYGVVVPAVFLHRWVLVPPGRLLRRVCREIADAVAVCWRIAGYISRAVGRAIKWLAWNLVGRPVRWCYRAVVAPVGRWMRDSVWAPARTAVAETGRMARAALRSARETVRQARRDAWRALIGGARPSEPGEPVRALARTLGSTTNASGTAASPEISPRKPG